MAESLEKKVRAEKTLINYRGASLIRIRHPPRPTIGP